MHYTCRRSSGVTEEHQPYTIEARKAKLTAYVASQPGWHVVGEFTDDASGVALRSATEPFDTSTPPDGCS